MWRPIVCPAAARTPARRRRRCCGDSPVEVVGAVDVDLVPVQLYSLIMSDSIETKQPTGWTL